MKSFKSQYVTLALLVFISVTTFSSCLTSKRMDKYVADQYNNEIPKVKKKTDIAVSNLSSAPANISTTAPHTKVLPLLVYWRIDSRQTCALNSQIAIVNFSNTVNAMAAKGLNQKLNGQKLELTVEQVPATFALVDKMHVIWMIYSIHWSKIYIEPEIKDLVVSYKLTQNDNSVKTGNITIRNTQENKNLRFFQSWKSATTEYLTDYNSDVSRMTKAFVDKLMDKI